jgi:hypothetical protein
LPVDVDAWLGHELSPSVRDKPVAQKFVELAGRLLEAVEAPLKVTDFGCAVTETQGL